MKLPQTQSTKTETIFLNCDFPDTNNPDLEDMFYKDVEVTFSIIDEKEQSVGWRDFGVTVWSIRMNDVEIHRKDMDSRVINWIEEHMGETILEAQRGL